MSYPAALTDVVYCYDGSFQGFLCCVFESYARKELPAAVIGPDEGQTTLFERRQIETDTVKANRVRQGMQRFGGMARERIYTAFLSDDAEKGVILLRFVRLCFDHGASAAHMLGDPDCAAAFELERAVNNETCHCMEFLRFEERDGMLGAVLHPKHFVLPMLRNHFSDRFPDENYLIYDATHHVALVQQAGRVQYLEMQQYESDPGKEELEWQSLWKAFFHATTIEPRRNEKLQMGHCPKRFWADMVEMREQKTAASKKFEKN